MTLYLLPNVLGAVEHPEWFLPPSVATAVGKIDGLIAESVSGGRRYLKRFRTKKRPEQIPIALIDEEVRFLLEPILEGERWGVISDAGLPCLADPGAKLVRYARTKDVEIEAFVGPSSVTLALIQSGLSGQAFTFHGYIPKEQRAREEALKRWEKKRGYTHLFIEAPFRNLHTYQACLEILNSDTLLCVASNLTLPNQLIHTAPIEVWRKLPIPPIAKQPTIFLLYHH